MKKFILPIITFTLILITTGTYIFQNTNIPEIKYNLPKSYFHSEKFGEVKNFYPLTSYRNSHILILSTDKQEETSKIFALNIETGESQEILEFSTHKNFKDKISITSFNWHYVIPTLFDVKVNSLKINSNKDKKEFYFSPECVMNIDSDFKNAESYDGLHNLIYTKWDSKVIYKKDISCNSGFNFMFNNRPNTSTKTFYKNPYSVVCSIPFEDKLLYTKLERSGLNLYRLDYGEYSETLFDKLLVRNFIHANPLFYGEGICGIYKENDNYIVFLNNYDNYTSRDIIQEIAKIPSNNDKLEQVPDVYSLMFNNEYHLIYTSFDENGMGKLYLKTNTDKSPEVIVDNQPIIGRLKILEHDIGDEDFTRILFTTLENNEVHVKIYTLETEELKDITNMF